MGEIQHIVSLVVFNLFFLIFIIAIIIFIKQYRLKKKEHLDMIERQKIEHQKEILTTQLEMQQQTMQEIGLEIHDNVGQKLTLASIYTQQLSHENQAPQVNEKIETITNILIQSLSDLRALSKTLTDNAIETNSISKLLKTECKKINHTKACIVEYTTNTKNLELPYQTKAILVRVTQEFLQNSIKHADCKNCFVSLNQVDNKLILNIKDDGKGFDISKIKSNGIGLSNMKKRTEMINGIYKLDSVIGIGTSLKIVINLNV